MPPRRSARMAAVVERQCTALAPLPRALALFIFSLVPVDQRLRCLEVCKGWYATLNERSFWTRLDLSTTAGLARRTRQALLLAAAARAGGQLQALHLTDCLSITHEALFSVIRANADTLTELRIESSGGDHYGGSPEFVEAVLGAAPRLRLLAADVRCNDAAVAHRLLRNEGVFATLRVRKFCVDDVDDEAGVLALAADLATHTCLKEVRLHCAPLGALALDAVVDAAVALRLASLSLHRCNVTPASAPALARLISGGALTELSMWNDNQQVLDQPVGALIADALRANSTLTALQLQCCGLWQHAAAATLVLGALTAHRSLRTLDLGFNVLLDGDQAPALGAILGALVAADAPALRELHLSHIALNDVGLLGLPPLLNALALNTHLHTLNLGYSHCTNNFARNVLLPAVRANTSLRHLVVRSLGGNQTELMREAEALVTARSAAAAP
jgi:hypothetical protein